MKFWLCHIEAKKKKRKKKKRRKGSDKFDISAKKKKNNLNNDSKLIMFICQGIDVIYRHLAFASLLIIIDVARTLYKLKTRLSGSVSVLPSFLPPLSFSYFLPCLAPHQRRRLFPLFYSTLSTLIPNSGKTPLSTTTSSSSISNRGRETPTNIDSPTTQQEEIVGVFKVWRAGYYEQKRTEGWIRRKKKREREREIYKDRE